MKVSKGASLDRYYLFKLFGFGLFLHKIHHSDPVERFHSHPWSGLSVIFGTYIEKFVDGTFKHRRWFNWINAKRHHQVIINKPTWTLFFHLPKSNQWEIVDYKGDVIATEPWKGDQGYKDYENLHRKG
jgi:hypothetical protein